jgi:hypothetical protein
MTAPTGWPDPSRPGVPPGAGLWRLRAKKAGTEFWYAWDGNLYWREIGRKEAMLPDWIGTHHDLIGPCYTPAEVAALVKAARREEREACEHAAENVADGVLFGHQHPQWKHGYVEGAYAASEAIRGRGTGEGEGDLAAVATSLFVRAMLRDTEDKAP